MRAYALPGKNILEHLQFVQNTDEVKKDLCNKDSLTPFLEEKQRIVESSAADAYGYGGRWY